MTPMNGKAIAFAAVLALVWYFAPGVTEVPFSGMPLTRMSLFAFAGVWLLLFVVLPWRADASRLWFRAGAVGWVFLIGLKLFAASVSVPQGIEGTYECLVGVRDLSPHIKSVRDPLAPKPPPPPVGRVWRRVDRTLQFADNAFSPFQDSFHLLHLNYPPWSNHPKQAGPGTPARRAADFLDNAALMVTWRGIVDLPRPGIYTFRADSDGWWSVAVELDEKVIASGDPDGNVVEVKHSFEAVPTPIVIRYLRPIQPVDTPRDRRSIRFELSWDPPRSSATDLSWRRLYPVEETNKREIVWNRVAEGLCWGSFGGACLVFLIGFVFLVDWSPSALHGRGDRLALFSLALLMFTFGLLRVSARASTDSNWCTTDDAEQRRHLARSLSLYNHGTASTPAVAPAPLTKVPEELTCAVDRVMAEWAARSHGWLGRAIWHTDDPTRRPDVIHDGVLMDHTGAAALWAFEERLGIIALAQVLAGIGIMVCVYVATRAAFGVGPAILAAAAAASDVPLLDSTTRLLPDLPAAAAVALALVGLSLTRRNGSLTAALLTAVAVAAAVLYRVELVGFALGVLAVTSLRSTGRKRRRRIVLLLFVFCVAWLAVPIRNLQLQDRPRWVPTALAWRLFRGNTPDGSPPRVEGLTPDADPRLAAALANLPADARPAELPEDLYDPLHSALLSEFAAGVRDRPVDFLVGLGRKTLRLCGLQGWKAAWDEFADGDSLAPVRDLLFPLLGALAVVGAVVMRRRLPGSAGPILILLLLGVLPLIATDGELRRRVALTPLFNVLTGAVLWTLLAGPRPPAEPPTDPRGERP